MDENLLRILVVDDERPIRSFLRAALDRQYSVLEAGTGLEALQIIAVDHPDLVLLDLGLPDISGMEVTRRLREWSLIPIIILSVNDREQDKVTALDAGADDYLTKPFAVVELGARIRAAFRHCAQPETESVYENGPLMVDLTRREVRVNKKLVTLTPTEYDILRTLVLHAGQVLTHQQVIRAVWAGGESLDADAHLLRVNISNLRHKIEQDPIRPRHIITEPGIGYRLKDYQDLQ